MFWNVKCWCIQDSPLNQLLKSHIISEANRLTDLDSSLKILRHLSLQTTIVSNCLMIKCRDSKMVSVKFEVLRWWHCGRFGIAVCSLTISSVVNLKCWNKWATVSSAEVHMTHLLGKCQPTFIILNLRTLSLWNWIDYCT